jgi:hypothetical protein
VQLARALGERPEASLPQALEHAAALKAAYRFFDNAQIAHEKILASHVVSSLRRMQGHRVILAVQDTTSIDYSTHRAAEGLGPTSTGGHGIICHGTLAFTPQRLPLGVLNLRLWARDPPLQPRPRKTTRRARAIEDKESHKWLDSVQAVAALKQHVPGVRWVSVADREADVFEFFTQAHMLGVDVLVRAAWNRNILGAATEIFGALAAAPVVARKTLALPATGKRNARTAKLEIRACPLKVKAPRNGLASGLAPVELWGVWAYEPRPPRGVEALDWKLLTSVPVHDAEDALERLDWYAVRWGIEQWHKVLKSGCRIQMRQLESAERLQRLLTVYAIIAWRILYATMLSRLVPDMSCTVILADDEWEALYCRIHRTPVPPATPPPLREAVRWLARLGGFLARPGDGEPGSKTLWQGFQALIPMTEMYRIVKPHLKPGLLRCGE